MNQSTHNSSPITHNYKAALISLTSLFFMWGFLTSLNDILIPHLKAVFDLNYAEAMLVQTAFFIAYGVMSLPAGVVVSRFGYRAGILVGLSVAALGAFLFYPAAALPSFPLFLAALFVLATGITVLQVAANPYVAVLGPERTASSRLTLSQALNSLGHTIGPFVGAVLILGGMGLTLEQLEGLSKPEKALMVQTPYLILGAALFVLAMVMALVKLPVIASAEDHKNHKISDAIKHPGLVLAAIGIFVYVGAEVAIGSFLVNFFGQPNIGGLTEEQAGKYVSYYWGAAMVGRFLGSYIMRIIKPAKVLMYCGIAAATLVIATMLGTGQAAMFCILAVGFFNSVMFPTIFTLGINGMGKLTGQGSAIMIMCIAGGAVIPLLQGALADKIGIQYAFILPVLCYAYIVWFAKRSK